MPGRLLLRYTLTRFAPTAVVLLAGPVVGFGEPASLPVEMWVFLGLEVGGLMAGFLAALFPLRRRLRADAAGSVGWYLGSAALGLVALDGFSLLLRLGGGVDLRGLMVASVSGGLIAALPMLVTSWNGRDS